MHLKGFCFCLQRFQQVLSAFKGFLFLFTALPASFNFACQPDSNTLIILRSSCILHVNRDTNVTEVLVGDCDDRTTESIHGPFASVRLRTLHYCSVVNRSHFVVTSVQHDSILVNMDQRVTLQVTDARRKFTTFVHANRGIYGFEIPSPLQRVDEESGVETLVVKRDSSLLDGTFQNASVMSSRITKLSEDVLLLAESHHIRVIDLKGRFVSSICPKGRSGGYLGDRLDQCRLSDISWVFPLIDKQVLILPAIGQIRIVEMSVPFQGKLIV